MGWDCRCGAPIAVVRTPGALAAGMAFPA
jgi:hypothetical protein